MTPQPPAPEKRNGSSAHGPRIAEVAAPTARELESRQEVVCMLEGYLEQLEQGTAREPEEWLARHPGLSGPLEEYLATLKLLHREALNLSPGFPPEGVPPKETALGLLGDYQLLRELGRGGMGIVYEAEQLSLRRRVALKVLPLAGVLDRRQLQRFQNEALTASQLHHPHIVDVFGAGCERGVHYYAMRHIEGQTLAQLIAQIRRTSRLEPADGSKGEPESPPPPSAETDPVGRLTTEGATRSPGYYRAAAEIGVQVAEALDYAHEHGVVHRDIKPSNVLIDIEGQAWVADFGLARLHQQAHLTQSGDLLGTLRYMSAEQALAKRGVLDHRTDIYALGATLYELLTLQPAVPGTDRQEILRRIAFEEPARPALLNPAIPLDLEAIVLKAMAKVPEERYATTHELADDLRRFLNDQPVQARRFSRWHQAAKWARRHRRPLIVIVVGAVLMLALAVVLLAVSNFRIREALAARDQALDDLHVQEQQTRAAERDKTLQLALARWNEAKLSRLARRPGQRYHSLEALADTVRHLRSLDQLEAKRPELRDDALASLTLWDVRAVKRLAAAPARSLPAVDPLGHHYACADAPNAVSWRRLADNQVVHRWQWERSQCIHIKVSPDGRYVAALCLDDLQPEKGVCHVWDSGTGRLVLERPASHRCAHDFRPDGKVLALAQADGSIALCDLGTGRDLSPLPAGPMPDNLRFHPGGQFLAVSFFTHPDVVVWDPTAAKVVLRLVGDQYGGGNLAWSPDGSLLAVGSRNSDIYLRAFPGGESRAVLRGHEHVVTRIEFHPSGRLLASSSHDETTRLWCFSAGGELILPGERLLGFSRDGRLFTQSFRELTEWEVANPGGGLRYLPHGQGPSRGPWGIAFAPDGRLLASASQVGVLLWDAVAARPVGRVPSGWGYSLAFAPNGRQLFTTGPGGWMQWPIVPERDGQSLRVGPGTVVRPTTAESRSLRIDVAGTGESLLLGAGDGGVDLVPLAEPGKVRRLASHDDLVAVALSPDGRWAASAGDPIRIWDVARGALACRLTHDGGYIGAKFSPDGRWLVTGSQTDFRFWEVGSWELKVRLPRDPRSLYCSVAFACDGRLLALVDGRNRIHLYAAAALPPRRLATLETPDGPANLVGVSLSPDGTRLAATTDYNVIALWDLRRLRQELAALDLDWDMLPYLPPGRGANPVPPLDVEVLPADKAPR